MPLGVGDHIVAANTAGVSCAQLNVHHVEAPESQVVGEHVQLRQEGGPGLVDGGDLVETVQVYDGLLPEEGVEELHDRPHRVLQELRLLQGGEGVEGSGGLQLGQESEEEKLFLLLSNSQQVWEVTVR